jgi:hypothetical protein
VLVFVLLLEKRLFFSHFHFFLGKLPMKEKSKAIKDIDAKESVEEAEVRKKLKKRKKKEKEKERKRKILFSSISALNHPQTQRLVTKTLTLYRKRALWK